MSLSRSRPLLPGMRMSVIRTCRRLGAQRATHCRPDRSRGHAAAFNAFRAPIGWRHHRQPNRLNGFEFYTPPSKINHENRSPRGAVELDQPAVTADPVLCVPKPKAVPSVRRTPVDRRSCRGSPAPHRTVVLELNGATSDGGARRRRHSGTRVRRVSRGVFTAHRQGLDRVAAQIEHRLMM